MADKTEEVVNDEFVADPAISYDEEFPQTPEFIEAARKAQAGQYDHTMFEMWEDVLDQYIAVAEHGVTMATADGLLRQWPWLKYSDLDGYLTGRKVRLEEARLVLQAQYPKPVELLFQENVDDFLEHKDEYINVMVAWSRLVNKWSAKWEAIPSKNQSQKGVQHAVISDVASLLINPQSGLIENLRHLANFNETMTDEDGNDLVTRIHAVHDETDER